MTRIRRGVGLLALAAMLGLTQAGTAWAAPDESPAPDRASSQSSADAALHAAQIEAARHSERVCDGPAKPGFATCLSVIRTDIAARPGALAPNAIPSGYGPADLQDAYDLPSGDAGAGQTVAIVDAYDNPNAEEDLAVYRAQYGLPECSTANGCFHKVSQRGDQNFPPPDPGWAGEIALDLDMVSAACPHCDILLVEADDNQLDNLGVAVNQAVALGAKYVSNSYGAVEGSWETTYDQYYNHPGVAITASSGDSGFGVSYPAASEYVTAVGGTSLLRDGSDRGWTETVWAGAGSGCSGFELKPSWQTDTVCPRRTVADVAAVSDPTTGVAVYNTYQSPGWRVFGGTSAAAPLIASAYALAGAPAAGTVPAQYLYEGASELNDITSGANGDCAPAAYLCTGTPGYDGPSGLGTPRGVGAFTSVPRGVVSGTVTDADTGAPIGGALITAGGATAVTGQDGTYVMGPRPGTYDITVTAYGYRPGTVSGVVIDAGDSVTEDFALDAAPSATLRGTVRDGSGHGWPIYARVSVPGSPEATYTDPRTGQYEFTLPADADYSVVVDPVYPGYERADARVRLTGDTTQDVEVPVDLDSCAAPGYAFDYGGEHQGFDESSAPAGWSVDSASPHGFEFDNPDDMPNNTGGTGNFALADPYYYSQWQDTTLTSPAFDLSSADTPVVEWKQEIHSGTGTSATVELSVDGGEWQTVYTGPVTRAPQSNLALAVAVPQAAGHGQVRVRFHYAADAPTFWWEVDDVFVGNRACVPLTGALLTGEVTNRTTGTGVNRAVVSSVADPSERTTAVFTLDDPALGDGFYYLFAEGGGRQRFQASQVGYRTEDARVRITADAIVWQDFALRPSGQHGGRGRV